MLSYLSLTNVTQNTLNLIVATTKHFPALKAYVIDIHNDSCKLLVSQACTVDDYYLLADYLNLRCKLSGIHPLLNGKSITKEAIAHELICNTASLCYTCDYPRGRDYPIITCSPNTTIRQCLRASDFQMDCYQWIYNPIETLVSNNPEAAQLIKLIHKAYREDSLCLAAYTDVIIQQPDTKGYLPMKCKFQTGYNPVWDSHYLDRFSPQPDMQMIHNLELETLMYGICTTRPIYTFSTTKLVMELMNYDKISAKTSCLEPVSKIWHRVQYSGWGMNRLYIIQKPINSLNLLLLLASGSMITFICASPIILQWISDNDQLLNSYTKGLCMFLARENSELLEELTSIINNSQVFSGEECEMTTNKFAKDTPDIHVDKNLNIKDSAVTQLLKDTFDVSDISQSQAIDYRNLYNSLSDVTIPHQTQYGYSRADIKKLLQMCCNFPEESAQARLDKSIGQQEYKSQLKRIIACDKYEMSRNSNYTGTQCLVLTGNPGSGKTHFAKLTAELFAEHNLTKAGTATYELINASSLVGAFQGSTSAKTREMFVNNANKTLIIENPSILLQHNDYGRQAISELSYQIEHLSSGAAVILTDTSDGFAALLEICPSLEMTTDVYELHDYNDGDLYDVFIQCIKKEYGYSYTEDGSAYGCMKKTLTAITGDAEANGTLVENAKFSLLAAKEVLMAHAENPRKQDDYISREDFQNGFNAVLAKYKDGNLVISAEFSFHTETETSFNDIIGNKAAMDSLQRIVKYIKNPEPYKTVGASLPNGILLEGAPGTGKTQMARALAHEANIPFCYVSGAAFVQKYVGEGAHKIRKLFKEARKRGKCIIFIDEIDAIGSIRSSSEGTKETEHTLNQLLTEMDGFASTDNNIFVLGATNLVEKLDAALIRPGRFDEIISINLPTKPERTQMFKQFASEKFDISDEQYTCLAELTTGCSGADIHGIVEKAKLLAGERECSKVTYEDLSNSVSDCILGHMQNNTYSPEERKRIAYHEAGHAFITQHYHGLGSIHKVTIVGHGSGSLGLSWEHNDISYLHTKTDLLNNIDILLAGYCAEQLFMHDTSSGVMSDLQRATKTIFEMTTNYGMYPDILYCANSNLSETNKVRVEQLVHAELQQAKSRVTDLLNKYSVVIEKIVEQLLLKEELNGNDIDLIFESLI